MTTLRSHIRSFLSQSESVRVYSHRRYTLIGVKRSSATRDLILSEPYPASPTVHVYRVSRSDDGKLWVKYGFIDCSGWSSFPELNLSHYLPDYAVPVRIPKTESGYRQTRLYRLNMVSSHSIEEQFNNSTGCIEAKITVFGAVPSSFSSPITRSGIEFFNSEPITRNPDNYNVYNLLVQQLGINLFKSIRSESSPHRSPGSSSSALRASNMSTLFKF